MSCAHHPSRHPGTGAAAEVMLNTTFVSGPRQRTALKVAGPALANFHESRPLRHRLQLTTVWASVNSRSTYSLPMKPGL
jgi:hypothetical protein